MSGSGTVTVYSASNTTPLVHRVTKSLSDLWRAFIYMREIWSFLAVQDVKSRFRRSYFGIVWMVAHQLTFALGAGMLWSVIFHVQPGTFIPFIASGFAIWGLIAAGFVDGSNAFLASQGYIRQVSMPLQIFIFRHWTSALIPFAIGTVTAIVLAIVLNGLQVIAGLPYFVFGTALLALCILMVTATMSYVGVIYGDVTHAMAGIFQMLFVVSPVIYTPEVLRTRGLSWFVELNPFTSMLEIVRVPIVDQTMADPFYYVITIAVTAVFALAYALLDATVGRRVIYYL